MPARTLRRVCRLAIVAASLGFVPPEAAPAQTTAVVQTTRDTVVVTINIPLSLSNLHPAIAEVNVVCFVTGGKVVSDPTAAGSDGRLWGDSRVPVVGGSVSRTVTVLIPVTLDNQTSTPVGTTSTYSCRPEGWGADFRGADLGPSETDPRFKLDKDPTVTGTITW